MTIFPESPYDKQRFIDGQIIWFWNETHNAWEIEQEMTWLESNTSVTGTFFSSENI